MLLRAYDRITIFKGGEQYKYTIDVQEDCYGYSLGLIEVCRIIGKDIRDALDIIETNGGVVNRNSGSIFFKDKEKAEEFINMLKGSIRR